MTGDSCHKGPVMWKAFPCIDITLRRVWITGEITWWRHQMEIFPRYWPFVRGTHRSPMNSSHKSQWRVALMFSFICAWTNGWPNNRDAGDFKRHGAYYDVAVMSDGQTGLWPSLRSFSAGYRLSLQWRHDERDGVSNHQPHECLLNRLFRRRSKRTSKLRVTGLCAGNSPLTGEFPAQRASNTENVSIWWRRVV